MSRDDIATLVLPIFSALLMLILFGVPAWMRRRRFARAYPDGPFVAERTFTGVSGHVAGVTWGFMLRVAIGANGLRLSVAWPFSFLLPALVIPWTAVSDCQRDPQLLAPEAVRLDIDGEDEPIYLRKFLWRDDDAPPLILDYWQKGHVQLSGATTAR